MIHYGYNSVNLTGEEVKKLDIQKVLIVTDQGVRNAAVLHPLLQSLEAAGLPIRFDMYP